MNCHECQENLVAYLEGALEVHAASGCERHLQNCPACQSLKEANFRLRERLLRRGQTASEVSLVAPVMSRIREFETSQGEKTNTERSTLMSRLFTRWGLRLGVAAGATAVILIALLVSPKTQASAAEVLARGARAVARLSSIHIRGQLRTAPQDNFSAIMPDQNFATIELWKQFTPDLKWRVEKPARVAVMDGQSTLLFIRTANLAMRVPRPSQGAFDTQWLQEMADLSETLNNELTAIKAHGWPVTLTQEPGSDARTKSRITVEAKSGLPDSDYLKNKFFMTADTRRVYVFDNQTELLESVRIYLHSASGDVLIFELQQIDYNQAIDPAVFQLELPANVSWYQLEMQKLPDNEKYAAMTAQQAARAYFEAFAHEDWTEAEKFRKSPVIEDTKPMLSGLEIVSLGEAFASAATYDTQFVPYEIKLNSGEVIKHNLALKKDTATGRWFVDGGGF